MDYHKIAKRVTLKAFRKREFQESNRLYSETARRMFRQMFDRRAWPFFELYPEIREALIPGNVLEEPLEQKFMQAMRMFIRSRGRQDKKLPSALVINQLMDARPQIIRILRQIQDNITQVDSRGAPTGQLKIYLRRLFDIFVPILESAARDKGVFITSMKRKSGEGSLQWPHFRQMRPNEQAEEKLKDDDPEAYEAIVTKREMFKEIDANIEESILMNGQKHARTRMYGRLVHVGKDPVTQEEYIYDPFSETARGIPVQEWVTDQKQKQQDKRELSQKNKKSGRLAGYSDRVIQGRLKDMRIPKWEEVEWSSLQGEVEYVAITDDLSKTDRQTKVFPTKTLFGRKIVTEGRFQGIFLDDLINEEGRLLEGNSYVFDEKLGRPIKVDPGSRDPYCTVAEIEVGRKKDKRKIKKLYMRIPGKSEYTQIRKAIRLLERSVPSVQVLPDPTANPESKRPRAIKVYFDPKDFTTIKKKVKSLTLSAEALKLVRDYLKNLAHAEVATQAQNLEFYSAENIGGFKKTVMHPVKGEIPFEFLTKQKEVMAWLDANENSGVCALDTGVGKTISAIGMMQKLIRDGYLEDAELNGRFLYVAPAGLVGNIDKETRVFLEEQAGMDLRNRLDAVSYQEFAKGHKTREVPKSLQKAWGDRPWEIEKYIAIFFDEAQNLKKLTWGASKAAFAVNHPRKICLTASPMDKEPGDAFVLASICNNLDLTAKGDEGRENRKQMWRFKKRFCKVVGGRVVGTAEVDPDAMYDLDVWVKKNVFFADKRDIVESPLPELKKETIPVAMDKTVGDLYREVSREVAEYLANTARIIETQKEKSNDREWWKITGSKFNQITKLLNGLANYPDKTMMRIAEMMGKPIDEVHPALKKMIQRLKKKYTAADLQNQAKSVPNVKINQTKEIIQQRIEDIDSKTLLFTDDKDLVIITAQELSKSMGGYHAACLGNMIHIFEGGSPLKEIQIPISKAALDGIFPMPIPYGQEKLSGPELTQIRKNNKYREAAGTFSTHDLPFSGRNYKLYPQLPAHDTLNPQVSKSKWHKFVLDNIISNKDLNFTTCTLLGKIYSTGQNLQRFDTVIHLDRDNWNSEEMKQRTARAWRQGQSNSVEEFTLDAVFDAPIDESHTDPTLDQVRNLYQSMEAKIFDRIIKESQETDIGKEFLEMRPRHASMWRASIKNLEFSLSPYLDRSTPPGGKE